MIKYFCDRCGKEITGNVNKIVEDVPVVDTLGATLCKFDRVIHICDECQHNELTCGFKVGDKVITSDGRVGEIFEICTCDECRKRGFFEPTVEFDDGDMDYITISAKKNGFKYFYQIGDKVFGNLDDGYLLDRISCLKGELQQLESQLAVVNKLKK